MMRQFLIMLFSAMTFTAYAQEEQTTKWKVTPGIVAGINSSWFDFPAGTNTAVASFKAGGIVLTPVSRRWFVNSGLLFEMQAADYSYEPGLPVTLHHRYQWLKLPLGISFRLLNKPGFSAFAGTGASWHHLLRAQVSVTNPLIANAQAAEPNNTQWCPYVAIGFDQKLTERSFVRLSLEYATNASRFFPSEVTLGNGFQATTYDVKLSSLSMSVALLFGRR